MLRLVTLLAAAAFATLPAVAQDGPILLSPEAIGQIFCLARIGNDMAPVQGILSPDLADLIEDAEKKSDEAAASNPDDKPPLGDGVPWQAFQDYAPRCTVDATAVRPDGVSATVSLHYGFPESKDADFTDTVYLTSVDDESIMAGRWRVDDIGYATGGTLRQLLADVIAGTGQ